MNLSLQFIFYENELYKKKIAGKVKKTHVRAAAQKRKEISSSSRLGWKKIPSLLQIKQNSTHKLPKGIDIYLHFYHHIEIQIS